MKVRVLVDVIVDDIKYLANQVVNFTEKVAKELHVAGHVDRSPDAVDYCVNELGAKPIDHESAKAATAGDTASTESAGDKKDAPKDDKKDDKKDGDK